MKYRDGGLRWERAMPYDCVDATVFLWSVCRSGVEPPRGIAPVCRRVWSPGVDCASPAFRRCCCRWSLEFPGSAASFHPAGETRHHALYGRRSEPDGPPGSKADAPETRRPAHSWIHCATRAGRPDETDGEPFPICALRPLWT